MIYYTISPEEYDVCKFVIYLICLPLVCIPGLVGNSYSLYILRAYPTRHAFCTYLTALTCTDTALLGSAFLRCLILALKEADVTAAHVIDIYVGTYAVGMVLGPLMHRLSSSLITVIAVERLLVVKYPFKVRRMALETHPVKIIIMLVLFNVLLQLPSLAFIQIPQDNVTHSMNISTYSPQRSEFAVNQLDIHRVYLFTVAIIGVALPFLIVITSTIAILTFLKMRLKCVLRRRVTGGSIETERMTLTLVTMATFFTLLSVPAIIIYVWTAYDRSHGTKFLRLFFTDINIVLVCLNSASDFIIYCLASEKFRTIFMRHFCTALRRSNNTTSSSPVSTIELSHNGIPTVSNECSASSAADGLGVRPNSPWH